jgi:hypothetical protein
MRTLHTNTWMLAVLAALVALPVAWGAQPPVAPGPGEPDWPDLLEKQWGLHMDRDLRNPVVEGVQPAALFVKADPDKPVSYVPILALGLESTTRGGWYPAGPKAGDVPDDARQARRELWSYAFKQPESQMQSGEFTPPPLASGEVTFDPGTQPFGLWASNDDFDDGGVYTQPAMVAKANARLRSQPYKAMIYPYRDGKTGEQVFTSYLIGWEYSTNERAAAAG